MRRTIIALSAAALTLTLGACGGQGSTGSSESGGQPEQKSGGAPFADAASLVSGAGSSMDKKQSVAVTIETTGGPGATPGASNMECQIDIKKTSMSCSGGPVEIVSTPEAMYMKNPQLAQMGGDPSKPWMKISADPNSPMGKLMGQQTQSFQKLTDFEAMLPPGSTIESNSQEQVNGKDATRYETVTDITKAAAEAPAEMQGIYQMLVDGGVKEIKQTIWVDSEGLPLKAVTHNPAMKVMGTQVPPSTTTMTYKDWGKPVTVTVPPSAKVQDMQVPQVPTPPN